MITLSPLSSATSSYSPRLKAGAGPASGALALHSSDDGSVISSVCALCVTLGVQPWNKKALKTTKNTDGYVNIFFMIIDSADEVNSIRSPDCRKKNILLPHGGCPHGSPICIFR